MPDIFSLIKSIHQIPRNKLPHAEKTLLVNILIHFGNSEYIWATNQQLADRVGECKDYVKNLIHRLKKKRYLVVTGRGKNREIRIDEKIIFGNSQLPNGNSQLPNRVLPLKEKKRKRSGAAPDCFENYHPYLDEVMRLIPGAIRGQLSRPFVNKCLWDKNGDRPYFNWLFENCVDKRDPAGWVAEGMMGYYASYLKTLKN